MFTQPYRFLPTILVAAGLLAGCGDDDDRPPAPTPTPTVRRVTPSVPAQASATPTGATAATPTRTGTRVGTPATPPTPLGTISATPTRSVTPSPGPVGLMITSVDAEPGTTVQVAVRLTQGHGVAGTQNDLSFPPAVRVARRRNGQPDCAVNPAIGKSATSFGFQPPFCLPDDCQAVRAVVLALDNVDVIPVGSTLYTCTLTVAEDADGVYPLGCTMALSSDPEGNPIDTACAAGEVRVSFFPIPTPTPDILATLSPAPSVTGTPTWTPTPTPT